MSREEWFLGVDPGLASGIALVKRVGDVASVVWSVEVQPDQVAPVIRPVLAWWQGGQPHVRLTVVVETFTITSRTAKLSSQPWSLESIGVVKQCMRDVGMDLETQLVMQKPAVKSVVDNEKLKRVELYHKGGAGHANDALRHIAVRLINVGWRDPRLLG